MRLIDADALGIGKCNPDIFEDKGYAKGWNTAIELVASAPTIDAVPVVRCRECVNYVESEDANGEKMCVKDADWCVEDGCYYGFSDYPTPDWYCADGKRREDCDGDG